MTTYLNIDDALSRTRERTQGQSATADEEWLTELLEMSKGTDANGVAHYRPYLVAARFLEQRLASQTLSQAEGVVFTGLALPIASLLALQSAYDRANALTIPAGFEVGLGPTRPRSRTLTRTPSP